MQLRTTPAHNYYILGPKGFGPYAFMVGDDRYAEREFQEWLLGRPGGGLMFGPRPAGQYHLWRQDVPLTVFTESLDKFIAEAQDSDDDRLVACEQLPLAFEGRPQLDYTEYRFIGQIKNYHDHPEIGVEDVFAVASNRPDRVLVMGIYGEATPEEPEPCWHTWFNTTMPTYAPHSEGLMYDLGALLRIEFQKYRPH